MHPATTMEALIFEGPGRMSLRPLPRPAVRDGEVLVRVRSATICGTDVRILAGRKTRDVRAGSPIGHECGGTVAAVGAGVAGFAVGDRVGLCPVVSCGDCEHCLGGHENLCESRITLGYHTDGSFAEFMPIPARAVRRGNLFRLPEGVSFDAAALLEPLGCCINGQHEAGLRGLQRFSTGRSGRLVIFGAGPIGLLHLLLVTRGNEDASCPWEVTVVEPRPLRRATALEFGANFACPPEELDRRGDFDAAIIAVGVPQLIPTGMQVLRKGGRLNLFAGFDAGAEVAIDPNMIHYRQLQVTGASESRRSDFAEALSLVAGGRIRLDPLITKRFPLRDHQAAFQAASDGSALKIAFEP